MQVTKRHVQTHTQIQTLAVLDMQTQIPALNAVHVAHKLDAVQIILVYKNTEKAAVDFGACMCMILGGSRKLSCSDCEN